MWVCKYLPYLLSLSLLCSHVIASPAPQAPGRIESPLPSATPGPNASASPADLRGSESGEAEEVGDDASGDPTPTPTAVEERTDSVSVTTITRVDRTIQSPEPPSVTPDPRTLGYVNSRLDTRGNPSEIPFATGNPRAVGRLDTTFARSLPSTTYTSAATISASMAPLTPQKREAAAAAAAKAYGEAMLEAEADQVNFLPVRQDVANIFTPIATTAPPSTFPRRNSHPVSKPPLAGAERGRPIQTNKFYVNMMLGNRSNPVFTFPYEVWWSNQKDAPWGLGIDHREPEQRVFGPAEAPSGANQWYSNPILIRSLQLGATEFTHAASTLEMSNLGGMSVDTTFYADPSVSTSTGKMAVTLCQGMGFVSATYSGLTPVLDSAVLVRSLSEIGGFAPGALKYRIVLENDSVWNLYSFPAAGSLPLDLNVVNNGHLEATRKFTGLIQVAKISKMAAAAEAVIDAAAGGWCKSASVAASISGSTGRYQFNFERRGSGTSGLLMFALPHHVQSFESTTAAAVRTAVRMWSPTKGLMTAVVANQWRLVESGLPTNIGWMPVKSGSPATFSAANLNRISAVAKYEMQQDFSALSNLDTMYFSGKALAKFAYICLSTSLVLKDAALARTGLAKLKSAFSRFSSNAQQNGLVYETQWRGIISDALYKTGNPNVDFGSGYYNDHHFHYGYFIQTAAIIALLEKRHISNSGAWLDANRDWVNTLVRDVANPSINDPHFPVFRSFDWYHGHSWAKGLWESWDGKDEESSSEDYNFAYAMKLWGNVLGDAAMEARGNLMLGIMKRSMNNYMLLSNGNNNHPSSFVGNKVSGILFENKVDHTTYFGHVPQYIHGIHMLPLTPISPYIRSTTFVNEEWNVYFSGKTGQIDDGWKGILYANYAIVQPRAAFNFFNAASWQNKWLDGGASRTWYMAFAGGLGGAS